MNLCNICESTNTELLTKITYKGLVGMNFNWGAEAYICKSCGFVFWGNPMADHVLADRYSEQSKYEFDDNPMRQIDSQAYIARSHRQVNFIETLMRNKAPIQTVLEIGAASGYNLSLYKEKGLDCYGVEPSLINCLSAKKHYGIHMFNGVLSDFCHQDTKERYDLIILSHVLEHITNPATVIEQLSNINGQYMLIEVPTHDYRLIEEPYGYFCEEHVNYFSMESLSTLMNRFGYQIISAHQVCEPWERVPAGDPKMCTLWEKSPAPIKLPNSIHPRGMTFSEMMVRLYLTQSEQAFDLIRQKINAIPNAQRLAIWGTGHHSALLLGETSLEQKNIVHFYDSDTKKHPFTILGKPIMPFEPRHCQQSVDAILISSYIFQKNIQDIIARQTDLNVDIITLY